MDDSPQDDDHWTIAWTNALDTYLKDVDARKELEENAPNDDLIPAGEPRSWDDLSWQTGEPKGARPRSGVNRSEMEFTPHFVTDGEAPEGAWASMRYMHDLTAERQEMGAGMRETGDYHDYLRNKRHTFTPEERKHNDKMWADRREARLKHRRKALKRKAAACAAANTRRACPDILSRSVVAP
ncbi:hypothetical protein C8F04DRAFT_1279001 [Mycena alexandri]|uniref:Uncharacterized protein n=1 Tax=Mycena alexandri TaxID=1745969 RepID=A0AAD6RZ35_9AGAR|nr:hypothetical protein C8F04DRAFT_1279001 [Mycena alexandri]